MERNPSYWPETVLLCFSNTVSSKKKQHFETYARTACWACVFNHVVCVCSLRPTEKLKTCFENMLSVWFEHIWFEAQFGKHDNRISNKVFIHVFVYSVVCFVLLAETRVGRKQKEKQVFAEHADALFEHMLLNTDCLKPNIFKHVWTRVWVLTHMVEHVWWNKTFFRSCLKTLLCVCFIDSRWHQAGNHVFWRCSAQTLFLVGSHLLNKHAE